MDQVRAACQCAGQPRALRRGDCQGLRQQERDRGVRAVAAEQERGHAVGDGQRASEERPVGVVDGEQPCGCQRPVGCQPLPRADVDGRGTGELQRQADARTLSGDVVVEVSLVADDPRGPSLRTAAPGGSAMSPGSGTVLCEAKIG